MYIKHLIKKNKVLQDSNLFLLSHTTKMSVPKGLSVLVRFCVRALPGTLCLCFWLCARSAVTTELPDLHMQKKKKCACMCIRFTGTPAGLWVFRVFRHKHGGHTPWRIPLRSDRMCVSVGVKGDWVCVLWLSSLMQVAPQSENPSFLDTRLYLVPPPAAPPSNTPFPCTSHCTSPTHVAPPSPATRAPF